MLEAEFVPGWHDSLEVCMTSDRYISAPVTLDLTFLTSLPVSSFLDWGLGVLAPLLDILWKLHSFRDTIAQMF